MNFIEQAQSKSNYIQIANLASIIWKEHYIPIVGAPQIEYMLEKFQSAHAIEDQIANGYLYYMLLHENNHVGYFSFYIKEDYLFLSKLYVLSSARRKGVGKAALAFIENHAITNNISRIRLTVNKYNAQSIKAYDKMGFINVESIVQDIGSGYVMDDYVLEKTLK